MSNPSVRVPPAPRLHNLVARGANASCFLKDREIVLPTEESQGGITEATMHPSTSAGGQAVGAGGAPVAGMEAQGPPLGGLSRATGLADCIGYKRDLLTQFTSQ